MAAKNRSQGRCIGSRHKKPRKEKYSFEQRALAWAHCINREVHKTMPIDRVGAMTTTERMKGCIVNLTSGKGSIEDASFLAAELSLVDRLCDMDFAGSRAHQPIAAAAYQALMDMGNRHLRTRKWGLDGVGMKALYDLVELREAQLLHESNTVAIEALAYKQAHADISAGKCVKFLLVQDEAATA